MEIVGFYDANGDPLEVRADEGLPTTLQTALNRTDDSITTYEAGCTMTEVDLATDADVVVSAAPCVLLGWYCNVVMSAHDAAFLDGTVSKLTIPASTAAGVERNCHSAAFLTSLTVNSNDAATGKLVLFWRLI